MNKQEKEKIITAIVILAKNRMNLKKEREDLNSLEKTYGKKQKKSSS